MKAYIEKKHRKIAKAVIAAFTLAAFLCSAPAFCWDFQTAGDLLVYLDASNPTAGTAEWLNSGTLGNFTKTGEPAVQIIGGQQAVVFDGINDAYIGPLSVAGIEGSADRSIEVWVYNPSITEEEPLAAWGKRGQNNRNISLNYGSNANFGAATHWANDMGWNGTPPAGQWQYLVYTYDGATARVYHNTILKNSRSITLSTFPACHINIAVQNSSAGTPLFVNEYNGGQLALSGAIAIVRIHDGVLTSQQIYDNFVLDKDRFGAQFPDDFFSDGYVTLNSNQIALTILRSLQLASSVEPLSGVVDFVPADRFTQRIMPPYYHLGDFTLRARTGSNPWVSYSSAQSRDIIEPTVVDANNVITNIPLVLSGSINLNVRRIWSTDGGNLTLRFEITNNSAQTVELGSFGAAMVFNNVLTGRSLQQAHEVCSFSDPYMGGNAGYLQVTRLNGQSPALLVLPLGATSFEAYRPLNDDPTPRGITFEGFYEWMVHSKAYAQNEWSSTQPWNTATSILLGTGQTASYGFEFVLSNSIEDIEQTLIENQRPVVKGIPGYVIGLNENAKLFVKASQPISQVLIEPSGALQITDLGIIGSDNYRQFQFVGQQTGRSRLTIQYADNSKQYVHYNVIPSQYQQVQKVANFHETKQWFTNPADPFGRTYCYMSFDRDANAMVLAEGRSYISGCSDEPGAGPNLLMGIKNLYDPNPTQVQHLEQYVNNVLWGRLQYPNYGVRASLFYGTGWDQARSETTWRAYNYPHQAAIYWSLYRLARNHTGLVTTHTWDWYLQQAYKTGLAMKDHCGPDDFAYLSQFGLMVGSVYVEILKDLKKEGWTAEALEFENYMRERAAIWQSLPYPFGSEMPWDSTGQEEIYSWCKYFGYEDKAMVTLNAILAYTPSIPNWSYNGAGRRYFDSYVYGKWSHLSRENHHYGASLNCIPLLDAYRQDPNNLHLLRTGYGGSTSVLTNINQNGFGSMCFIADPAYMAFEPYTSDYGQAFYGYCRNAGAFLVEDSQLGWLSFGGNISWQGNEIILTPTDAFHRDLFIAPLGIHLRLDAGTYDWIKYNPVRKSVQLALSPQTPYTPQALLNIEQTAANNTKFFVLDSPYPVVRGSYAIPLGAANTLVTIEACLELLEGDLNQDCRVDFKDLALLANNWLACALPDCY